jgi:hypothetical protein
MQDAEPALKAAAAAGATAVVGAAVGNRWCSELRIRRIASIKIKQNS